MCRGVKLCLWVGMVAVCVSDSRRCYIRLVGCGADPCFQRLGCGNVESPVHRPSKQTAEDTGEALCESDDDFTIMQTQMICLTFV